LLIHGRFGPDVSVAFGWLLFAVCRLFFTTGSCCNLPADDRPTSIVRSPSDERRESREHRSGFAGIRVDCVKPAWSS
jgi:hypothetical protein